MNRTEISIFSILEFSVSLDGMYLLALGQVEERCSETMLLSLDMEFLALLLFHVRLSLSYPLSVVELQEFFYSFSSWLSCM